MLFYVYASARTATHGSGGNRGCSNDGYNHVCKNPFFRADGVHRFLSVFFNLFDPLLVKLNCGQCQIFFMAKEEKNGIFRIEIIQNIAQMTNHYLVS
ncbi:hypothetical protein AFK69_10620 [Xenorhabdus sp. GDc328]|nr:hypothetical protein AAY47_02875 [Xenorhabdus griffiniae]KOP33405.1 hypothetical protein AFK69_10620 [Xenorhabdus sp. GDc328]